MEVATTRMNPPPPTDFCKYFLVRYLTYRLEKGIWEVMVKELAVGRKEESAFEGGKKERRKKWTNPPS